LWAAVTFAAGITTGIYAWRPPLWWLAAWVVVVASSAYLLRRRGRSAYILGLGALFILGAFAIQVCDADHSGDSALLQFDDGSEVLITAHVTKEGVLKEENSGDVRQRLDLETEQVVRGNESHVVRVGLRTSVYTQQPRRESDLQGSGPAIRSFHYRERLRFSAKISTPRNFRNPGAFDYRTYLRENGIAALASTKSSSIEVLPGFSGNRIESLRSRIHRSIIEKIHVLWPQHEAALMDAMVIGEDAFIDRSARFDFQRSGTYHVLVVSGMNVSILALVTFWFLRRCG
jgi:competence protein ComEC